jgi:CheY-like chemotaxis protein
METRPTGNDSDQTESLATRCIYALLQRHSIRKHRQLPVLAEILGVAYQTVYRRLPSGDWSLDELERIAAHFGETLAQLLDLATDPATFVMGVLRLPCRVEVGGVTDPAKPASLIAVRGEKEWIVMPTSDAITAQSYDVKSLTIEPRTKESRVAVLDDEKDIAEGICAELENMGLHAMPFFSIEDLSAAIKAQRFDAYIIDWVIGRTTAQELIESIREVDPHCPIAILTGQLEEGGAADETEVAYVSAGENMQFYTKPLPVQIIGQRLKRALGGRGALPGRGAR